MSQNNGNLFDIRQSPVDGKFRVWIQKSELELGIIDREAYEAAGKPPYMNQQRWVVAGVFDKKPTTTAVLDMLGVKRKEQATAATATPTKPAAKTRAKKQPQPAAA